MCFEIWVIIIHSVELFSIFGKLYNSGILLSNSTLYNKDSSKFHSNKLVKYFNQEFLK
jgi:hypothetical protein